MRDQPAAECVQNNSHSNSDAHVIITPQCCEFAQRANPERSIGARSVAARRDHISPSRAGRQAPSMPHIGERACGVSLNVVYRWRTNVEKMGRAA
jgi:hypothetical protein